MKRTSGCVSFNFSLLRVSLLSLSLAKRALRFLSGVRGRSIDRTQF